MLEYFHIATLQGKLTLYDVYQSIERRSDGANLCGSRERYAKLTRVMRFWRFLKQLKRGGLGCQIGRSLDRLSPGELAVLCPACPRPEVNLPPDWETVVNSYLYNKFIAVDACFRLKRRFVSSEAKDPGLMTGAAYYVPQEAYQKMMASPPNQVEEPGCNGSKLAAIDQATTKYNKGYATTGVILCLCARHEIVEPNGLVDVDKGEKYWHTDWAISASQRHSDARLTRVLSYDICCQYHKHFFERLREDMPEEIRLEVHEGRWRFVVPKLHIQGHGRPCQENFAFYLLPGAGQTDGEGIERRWANLGGVATATVEMAPGHRREILDDHIAYSNWLKVIFLGDLLSKRRREARRQIAAQQVIFIQFSESQAEHWPGWAQHVLDWETGKTNINPYSLGQEKDDTEAAIHLEYAKEEIERAKAGEACLHEISPSAFVEAALEVEEL
ncbi:hypothetical protein V5O48_019118, partial [Marasmius crinis-equi]